MMNRAIALTTLLFLTLGLGACGMGGKLRASPEPSLYERLGGKGAIVAVVDDFVGNVAADNRINHFFANTDIPRLKMHLVNQICQTAGGPCVYTGRDMKSAHARFPITGSDFNALVEDLVKTLDKFKVPDREQKELLTALGGLKKEIVNS